MFKQHPLQSAQNGFYSTEHGWKFFGVIAITWTAILVCITLSMYQSEECAIKWRRIQDGLSSAMSDVQVLKEQNTELRYSLKELARLQILDMVNSVAKNKDKKTLDLLDTLLTKQAPEEGTHKDRLPVTVKR